MDIQDKLFSDLSLEEVEEMQEKVIASNNLQLIFDFAIQAQGADIQKLEDAVIASKNAEYIAKFVIIPGANVEKLIENTLKYGDKKDFIFIKKNAKGVNLDKVDRAIDAVISMERKAMEMKKKEQERIMLR